MRLQLAIAAVLLSSPVLAADLVEMAPAPPPPVVAANPFNGFYAGVHVGYGWGNISGTGSTPLLQEVPAVSVVAVDVQQQILGGFPFDYDQDGWVVGGQLGYNWVGTSGLLLGAEISGSWANIKGSVYGQGYYSDSTWDAIGIAQGKIGWANDRIALYASAGGALGHNETRFNTTYGSWNFDNTQGGWTVGAGADVMVHKNVSLGLSYNYIDFGSMSGNGGSNQRTGFNYNADANIHLIKLNLNYHF